MLEYILEVNVREELSKTLPTEALFKLTHYIAIQNLELSKISVPTSLDLWIIKATYIYMKN